MSKSEIKKYMHIVESVSLDTSDDRLRTYKVFLNGKHIDTVFYVYNIDAEEVRRDLIDHDGFDEKITVTQESLKIVTKNGIITEAFLGDNGINGFKVFLQGKLIDVVYAFSDMTKEEVRDGLVQHDGFDRRIQLVQYEGKPFIRQRPVKEEYLKGKDLIQDDNEDYGITDEDFLNAVKELRKSVVALKGVAPSDKKRMNDICAELLTTYEEVVESRKQ